MKSIKTILRDTAGHLRRRPADGWRILRGALSLRVLVPVEAFRWGAARLGSDKVKDIAIREAPPGLRILATAEVMETPLRIGATVSVEKVVLGAESLRVTVRIARVELQVLDEKVMSPVAALVRSGALDVSRPATLLAHMPTRPRMIVEAEGETITLELLRQSTVRAALEKRRWLAPILERIAVKSLRVRDGFVELALDPVPPGLGRLRRR